MAQLSRLTAKRKSRNALAAVLSKPSFSVPVMTPDSPALS
jgi:hypothetical protein